MKAFSVLESALAEKYNHGLRIDERSELELLLKQEVSNSLFKGSDVFLKELPKMISNIRNNTEHGDELYKNSLIILQLCSELINQIYHISDLRLNPPNGGSGVCFNTK